MKKLVVFLALALAALALVACGSSNSSSSTSTSGGEENTESQAEQGGAAKEEAGKSSGGGSTLKFEADPNGELAYTTDHVTAKAGETTIEFNNPQSLTHDLVIEDSSGKEVARDELVADGSDTTTANLKPGTYKFFCSVPGHREAGMEGTLVVK